MIDTSKIKIGTCAWSFDDWRGCFYPRKLPHNEWLDHYARVFSGVEVDSTFYHAPSAHVAAHWLAQTPDDFRFACKLPRVITHEARLRGCEAEFDAFLEAMVPLRAKLGALLVQLPPSFSAQHDEAALRQFVLRLPRDFRFAIEFRHHDWHAARIVHLLEENGVCWVWNDTTDLEHQHRAAFDYLPQTAPFIYVRLLGDSATKYRGDGSRVYHYTKLMWPRDSSLESWAVKIQNHLGESASAFVFVNNHFEGFSPETCRRLGIHLGIHIRLPELDDEHQPAPPPDPQLNLL